MIKIGYALHRYSVVIFGGKYKKKQYYKTEFRLNWCKGGMRGVAFSSIPMKRLNQTESAVFDSCMSSVISKDPFSDCGHLNVS